MTATFGVGRSFSFAPNSPQEPCEADEYKHDLTKVVERDVHLASLLPEGGAAVAQPPKEFHLSQERKKRPLGGRADRDPFMAGSHGESPQQHCNRKIDRGQDRGAPLGAILRNRSQLGG